MRLPDNTSVQHQPGAPSMAERIAASNLEGMAAARAAQRYRAIWLLEVSDGRITTLDFINHAGTEIGKSLRSVTVRLLLSQNKDWGKLKVSKAIDGIKHQIRIRRPDVVIHDRMTVGWIVDLRSLGQRADAMMYALDGYPPVYPRFPYGAPGFPLTFVNSLSQRDER